MQHPPNTASLTSGLEPPTSTDILARFCRARDGVIRLVLEPAYLDLLARLGDPHKKLPPVLHVAGTNGKGSTCAFLRAMLEAAGKRVHVYTSPHLVHFHERIRIAGELIGEDELTGILAECERLAAPGEVSDFEAATAAAFVAFSRHPADAVVLETGMGGRLDATNVIETSAAAIITRLSYDHCKYLGDTAGEIAREKAGIMRHGRPCFVARQPEAEALAALKAAAREKGSALHMAGEAWRVEVHDKGGFRYADALRDLDLPPPALPGAHQYENAGLAIAALPALPFAVSDDAIARGLQNTEWPARLQHITQGRLASRLPEGWELWLDGGHNDSAGEVLAAQLDRWHRDDRRPVYLVYGMLTTKSPRAFLHPFALSVAAARTIAIPNEHLGYPADALADETRAAGIADVLPSRGVEDALKDLTEKTPGRILICGSLYLAGHVLALNGA
ncbi:MAG: folylpolyglutamate synthase/dihydrofolate synthase family protein [Bdellovibrionales bacterium]